MIKLLERIIKNKNPDFEFDKAVGSRVIWELIVQKSFSLLRSLKLLWKGNFSTHIYLGKSVQLFNAPNIDFGKYVQLDDFVYISALGKQKIRFGNNVKIGAFSRIITSTSMNDIGKFIHIGNNVGLGEFAYLGGAGGLKIGNDCIIGQYLSCHPENHNFSDNSQLIRLQGVTRKGISIGNNCWIGSKVTICDGVIIGNNCIIAAGAVVTKSMPDNSVIGGVPARKIKSTLPVEKAMAL